MRGQLCASPPWFVLSAHDALVREGRELEVMGETTPGRGCLGKISRPKATRTEPKPNLWAGYEPGRSARLFTRQRKKVKAEDFYGKVYHKTLATNARAPRLDRGESTQTMTPESRAKASFQSGGSVRAPLGGRVVAFGASAGGLQALSLILAALPPDFPAPSSSSSTCPPASPAGWPPSWAAAHPCV